MENEDKLSFLDGDKGATLAPDTASPPAPSPASPAPTEQPRDEQGKFAPKASDTVPAPVAVAPQPAPVTPAPAVVPAPTPEPKQEAIPLPVFLDMRDKLKAAEKRLSDFEQQRQTQPRQVPSATEDPEGFNEHISAELQRLQVGTTFNISEFNAREKHGDEPVTSAMQWAEEKCKAEAAELGFSPFAVEYMRQKHPIDWAVKQQKRHTLLAAIGDDPEAYIAAEVAKRTAAPAPTPEAQPATPAAASPTQAAHPAPAPAAPRSIAHVPAAGASQHVTPSGPGTAFGAVFQP